MKHYISIQLTSENCNTRICSLKDVHATIVIRCDTFLDRHGNVHSCSPPTHLVTMHHVVYIHIFNAHIESDLFWHSLNLVGECCSVAIPSSFIASKLAKLKFLEQTNTNTLTLQNYYYDIISNSTPIIIILHNADVIVCLLLMMTSSALSRGPRGVGWVVGTL